MKEFETLTLNNGIRVVYKQVTTTKITHCGIAIDVGSRDESADQFGIAHFWEHMAFKGTSKRKSHHIIHSIDSVGGELNAYTTKEKIYFYTSVLDRFIDKAFDILSDITFHSIFPEKQIERERQIILEEMAMYNDTPDDAIQDDLEDQIFGKHPLGHNILGNTKTVRSFTKTHFSAFINSSIDTSRIVVSIVGNLSLAKVKKLVSKYLEPIPTFSNPKRNLVSSVASSSHIEIEKPIQQAHVGIGIPTFNITDERRVPMAIIANLLGGSSMNTRLNMTLREKMACVYSIDAHYGAYADTGLFSIFYGTEEKNLKKSKKAVFRELDLMKNKPLGSLQLHRLKEQMLGQLAMAEESYASLMLSMAKSLLDLGTIQSIEEVFKDIEEVSAKQIQEISNEVFLKEKISTLTFKPRENGVY
ncbi:Peptidase, M16 family [hydrothermal vent metagenome]|uniref:Peptidase, M16 family n=1 Tax=hydrothermal vent metagenome TaxID=652676 RepID=A0A3B0UQP9_9ZZZZ